VFIETLDMPPATVLNINIPALPVNKIKGVKFTTLGRRLKSESPVRTKNPRGKTVYWIGRAGGPVENKPGTDFHEVANGYISITPIHSDMTHDVALKELIKTPTETISASIVEAGELDDGRAEG
jgi:5'-nucleotidase